MAASNITNFTDAVAARRREHTARQSRGIARDSADYDYEQGIDDTARWVGALGADNPFAQAYAEQAAWLRETLGEQS